MKKYKINEIDFVSTKFDGKSIWMNLETGQFLELNATATFLTDTLKKKPQYRCDIEAKVAEEYDVTGSNFSDDIGKILDKLVDMDLLLCEED